MTKCICDICQKPAALVSTMVHNFNLNPSSDGGTQLYLDISIRGMNNGPLNWPHHLCREHMREALNKLIAAFESGEGVIEL